MFKNLIFYAIVSIAMFYLLLTSPAKVDEVCSDAATVASSITDVVTASVSSTDKEKRDVEQITITTETSSNVPFSDVDMTPKQRSRREKIMTNLNDVLDATSFPDIRIVEPGDTAKNGNEYAARLENVREQMDRIYLQNSFGR